jgi:cystathionine beta-lyase
MLKETISVVGGRGEKSSLPEIQRASAFVYDDLLKFEEDAQTWFDDKTCYGSFGTSTTKALEKQIASLDDAKYSIALSSGMAAIAITAQSLLKCGDKILVSDGVYPIAKMFFDDVLSKQGIIVEYFDFTHFDAEKYKNDKSVKVVYIENPVYATFEVLDEWKIFNGFAKSVVKIVDNSWASPIGHSPLVNGGDIVVYSGTKNISGHGDVMCGFVTTNSEDLFQKVKKTQVLYGNNISPDDCYLVLRGIKTLPLRLRQAGRNAAKIAIWLNDNKKVKKVYCPFISTDKSYSLWREDFYFANGLLSFELNEKISIEKTKEFLAKLNLFGLSYGWGGCDSQIVEMQPDLGRKSCKTTGSFFRLCIGLEDLDDLIDNLEQAFYII